MAMVREQEKQQQTVEAVTGKNRYSSLGFASVEWSFLESCVACGVSATVRFVRLRETFCPPLRDRCARLVRAARRRMYSAAVQCEPWA